jgi:amino acid permease
VARACGVDAAVPAVAGDENRSVSGGRGRGTSSFVEGRMVLVTLTLDASSEVVFQVRDPQQLRYASIGLFVGALILCLATIWISIGKAWTRFHGWVYRTEDPKQFWECVVGYYLSGILVIFYFVYKLYIARAD